MRVSVNLWSQNKPRLEMSLLPRRWPSGAGKRGTEAATRIPSHRSYSGFKCILQMDRDYLDCLAGGQPSLICLASSRAQPGWTANQTPLPGLVCSATPLAQSLIKHIFIHSSFNLLASRREAKLCSVTGPNTISETQTVDQTPYPHGK